jgi:hypothetical protein
MKRKKKGTPARMGVKDYREDGRKDILQGILDADNLSALVWAL